MRYSTLFKSFLLIASLSYFGSAWAAGPLTCPNTSQPLPANWSVFQGQITGQDTFKQAILMSLGVMSSVNCVYNNPTGQLILTNYGVFQPYGKLNPYWGNCPTIGSAKCCMDSQDTCTFVQIALPKNTNSQ